MNSCAIFLLLGVILAVRGQDPTTICYPAIFQSQYYNLITEDRGFIYVDFAKQKFAEVSAVTGYRSLHDFANLKTYVMSGEGNFTSCKSFKLQQSKVMYRCLPPYARLVTYTTGYLHHLTAVKMYVQTWDVDTESDTVNRVIFSVISGQPAYIPVLAQEYGYHGTTNMYLYTNPAPAVSNQSLFTIPDQCATHDIKTQPIIV
jgi:hypothetical protein